MIHCETARKETFGRLAHHQQEQLAWARTGSHCFRWSEMYGQGIGVILKVPFALIPGYTTQMCKYFYSKQ